MGKLVVLEKFWVTAIAVSRLRTTCHHPPTQNTGFNLNYNHGCMICCTRIYYFDKIVDLNCIIIILHLYCCLDIISISIIILLYKTFLTICTEKTIKILFIYFYDKILLMFLKNITVNNSQVCICQMVFVFIWVMVFFRRDDGCDWPKCAFVLYFHLSFVMSIGLMSRRLLHFTRFHTNTLFFTELSS